MVIFFSSNSIFPKGPLLCEMWGCKHGPRACTQHELAPSTISVNYSKRVGHSLLVPRIKILHNATSWPQPPDIS